jgi:hypothetical protein
VVNGPPTSNHTQTPKGGKMWASCSNLTDQAKQRWIWMCMIPGVKRPMVRVITVYMRHITSAVWVTFLCFLIDL